MHKAAMIVQANPTTTAALIVAAGRGVRAGSGELAKQYRPIGGDAVLTLCIEAFISHPAIDVVQVVIGADDATHYHAAAPDSARLLPPVTGAATRQGSVLVGLNALATTQPIERVLIHDAARPFTSADLISRVVDGLEQAEAIVPTLPVTSTLKVVDARNTVTKTIPREGLFTAETPQGFRFSTILTAHQKAQTERHEFTDDAAIAEWAGIPVRAVAGQVGNIKLTTAADIAEADRRLAREALLDTGDIRVGNGYDVHVFGPGSQVMLGGVAIPHSHALRGHSDADVGLHALTDALLGALADGDIGSHFPPSDPQWKGASSDRFLADAVRRVTARGGIISHLDLTLVAEAPKIGPHRDAMRKRIAEICRIDVERVGVKATTSEGLGFTGRGEGIAAQATATIRLPFGRS
jgi:2-C-methyl-D-erythritol 4-phosphate cytidylyltransferase / 2-C-methyl-D-erythritol 2,4-cyclodiphosphate synthase